MQMVAAIYEYASEKTEIDHPLCLECNDILLHQLEREQRDIDKDLETYRAFLAQLQAEERKEMDDALFTQKIRQVSSVVACRWFDGQPLDCFRNLEVMVWPALSFLFL